MFEDDSSNPDVAVTKVNGLLNSKVVAVLGPTGLAATLATGGITAQKNVLQVTGAGIALPVERERKCLLHMMPAQHINAAAVLSYAVDGVKAKRVAVLYDSGVGQAIMNSMKDLAPKYAVNFVAAEKFDLAATDMSSQVAKLKAANPDAGYCADLVADAISQPAPAERDRAGDHRAGGRRVRQPSRPWGRLPKASYSPSTWWRKIRARARWSSSTLFQSEYKKLPKNFEVAAWEVGDGGGQCAQEGRPRRQRRQGLRRRARQARGSAIWTTTSQHRT